jgi:cell wall assembly regulator SMI1
MSQLIEVLNSIESWVHTNAEFEFSMRLGLMPEHVAEKLAEVSYKIPQEIIELYQWHNGGSKPFLPMPDGEYGIQEFFSLGEAISIALDWNEIVFPKMNAFPLFAREGSMYWTVVSEIQYESALIYSNPKSSVRL